MAHALTGIVTGASRGIGRGVAELLARRGFGLTITARDGDVLGQVAEALLLAGAPSVECVAAEFSDEDEVAGVVDAHARAFGDLSALVLAAGVGSSAPIGDYSLARWDKQFAVNTRGNFVAIRQALPLLRRAAAARPEHGAKIVAFASIAGVYAEKDLAAYGASKAALMSLCRSINAEESSNGISATAVAPAYVDTDMSKWVHDQVGPEEMIPVGDLANVVGGLLDLSARSFISEIVLARASTAGHHA
ncbi:MAG: SDR family NAD(P)-dependent oxidoreductase [Blastococcus sp.]